MGRDDLLVWGGRGYKKRKTILICCFLLFLGLNSSTIRITRKIAALRPAFSSVATVGPFRPNNRDLRAYLKMVKIHLENFEEIHMKFFSEIWFNFFAEIHLEKFAEIYLENFAEIHLENFAEIHFKILRKSIWKMLWKSGWKL